MRFNTRNTMARKGFRPWSFATMIAAALAAVAAGRGAWGQDRLSNLAQAGRGSYPHASLAVGFEVDPAWPKRPSGVVWGAVAGIAIDRSEQIWMFHRASNSVQVYRPHGELARAWDPGDVREPHQIRIDTAGHVWLVDSRLHIVRKYSPDGALLLTLGTRAEPGEDSTHFNRPTDVAVTAAGDIFVADGYGNNRIVHFDERGQFVSAWGQLGIGRGNFSIPHSIAVDSTGRLYVADRNNARVQVFDQGGRFLSEWCNLMVPWHIVVTDNDEIYVCGSSPMRWPKLALPGLVMGIPPKDQCVMVFATDGRVKRIWNFPKGQRPGELDWVHGMAVDRGGNLYLGDIQGRRAQKFVRLPSAAPEGDLVKGQETDRDAAVKRALKP